MLEALGHDPTEYREDGLYCARCGELIYKYEVLDNDPTPVSTQQPFSLKNIGTGSGNIVIDCPGSSTSPYYAGITAYLVYSKDQTTWNDVVLGSSIAISPNENVYIKAKTTNDVLCANGKSLVINGTGSAFEANGSIMWLLDGSGNKKQLNNSTNKHCFENLFNNFSTLVSAPDLPATSLADYCYHRMFYNCGSLVNAPELPATSLANNCYSGMFFYCESLVNAPQLPANNLANDCYSNMFYNCDSLINAPDLPATTLTDNCYQNMFRSCGSLVNAPELPATTLTDNCYQNMFRSCGSLVNAPELPATSLANNCYSGMFFNCGSLVNAPKLPATNLAYGCYQNMFESCGSLINAPKLPATTLVNNCYYYMFYDCSSLTKAPDLPATSLADYCYYRMFYNCTNLSYIKVEFTDWNNTGPNGPVTYQWLDNVAAVGRFICPGELDTSTAGQNYFPTGWSFGLNYTLEMGIENFSFRLPPPPAPIPGMEDIERDEYNANTSSKFTSFKVDSLEYFGTSYYRGNYDTVGRFGTNISGAPAPYNGYLAEGLHTYSVTYDGFTYSGSFVLHKQYYTDVSYSNPTNVITSYYKWEIIDSY